VLLSKLKPNKKNPRKISPSQLSKLKDSISQDPEFMVLRPIVYDSSDNNKILGGNMRFKACKDLGMIEIPDEWTKDGAGLSEEKKRRFILVDNAPDGMSGEWDFDILKGEWELPELEGLGFDIDDFEMPGGIPENNKDIDEEDMANTQNECPKCGFKW
jgi:hypothetical protein